jgi:hypothetical protein
METIAASNLSVETRSTTFTLAQYDVALQFESHLLHYEYINITVD